MTLTRRESTGTMDATATEPLKAVGATAKPMANKYPQAAASQEAAVKTSEAMMGHNVFRPDIYRVSEGYLS